MRSRFDEQLALLNKELIEMGALCEEVIKLASEALTERSAALAAKVAPLDSEIDQKERTIESMCLKLLLQQQPVAKDLRQISAALKMITDMERIGDQAEDIAEIISFLDGRPAENDDLMREMAKATIKMVTESVDAYVKHDIMLAEKVVAYDDTVDDYFDQVKRRPHNQDSRRACRRRVRPGPSHDCEVFRAHRRPRGKYRRMGDILGNRRSQGGIA
jgi:phosphate transport system protein